jgi:hypothetical protein
VDEGGWVKDSPGADDQERTRGKQPEGPTVWADPVDQAGSSSTADPAVASWSLDDLMRESAGGPLPLREPRVVYADDEEDLPRRHGAGYYLSLTAAVLLVVGVVGGLVLLTMQRPERPVAGDATGVQVPQLPPPSESGPQSTTPPPDGDPLAALAAHALSKSTVAMAPVTCPLPRFDTSDATQAAFYEAAKVCADDGFNSMLRAGGMEAAQIPVVTVQDGPVNTPCGAVAPNAPPRQCKGTVYMTPARLRDVEGLGLFPGKYFGVFLRTYASAVQYATGVIGLFDKAKAAPGAPADLAARLNQQATCLAGVAAGAMSGQGSVDENITGEIRARLTSTDDPPAAASWLTKGFDARQPSACNTWA